jgi:hypothetical protein
LVKRHRFPEVFENKRKKVYKSVAKVLSRLGKTHKSVCHRLVGGLGRVQGGVNDPVPADDEDGCHRRRNMHRYIFSYFFVSNDSEVMLVIPKFPEIISSMSKQAYVEADDATRQSFIADALLTALQAKVRMRSEIPEGDDTLEVGADGFISLSVQQSIKLELFRVYRANFRSVAEFARKLGKSETVVRRMFDLRRHSAVAEIEEVLRSLGKRLVHCWGIELSAVPVYHSER